MPTGRRLPRMNLRDDGHGRTPALGAQRRGDRAHDDDRVCAVVAEGARTALRRLRRPLAVVGRRHRGVLGLDLGLLRRRRQRPYKRVLGRREMPGAEWFPGARLTYAEHIFRAATTRPSRSIHGPRPGTAARSPGASCASRSPDRAPACASWASGRRPRRRLHAEHPRDDRRVPRHREHRRDWSCCSPDFGIRAWSTASRRSSRRCSSRSTATATAARTSTAATPSRELQGELPDAASTRSSLPYLGPEARTGDLGALSTLPDERRERRARRSSSVPFDHPLWVLYSLGHDRAAQGDRPRAGRHPARAPEGAAPARRPAARATGSSGSRRPAG